MAKQLTIHYQGAPCYDIVIEDSFEPLPDHMKKALPKTYHRVCIVTDTVVEKLYLEEVASACRACFPVVSTFAFPAGEAQKNLDTVQELYLHLIREHFDRGDLLIALGGGVVGDLTGFAAATYLRGIDFIQIPTTLLSQVDSSIGGKTGVDFMQYKNMVGAFYMPKLVYMNTSVLRTLPKEQFASGMAEIIKHGLIEDAVYYTWIWEYAEKIQALQPDALEEMIHWSCLIKGHVVEEDPKEQGIRAHLNFGHTIGHAIEKLSDFSLSHGQCVALGMIAAAHLSQKLGYLSEDETEMIAEVLKKFGLPTRIPGDLPVSGEPEEILAATKSDKKMSGTQIRFVILKAVGVAGIYRDFTDEDLLEAISCVTGADDMTS